jgi:hypothetical protein
MAQKELDRGSQDKKNGTIKGSAVDKGDALHIDK